MAKSSRKIVEKRPDEIINACLRLYETKPFQEISLKDISMEAGISRPSIYSYFRTKEEIFLSVLGREYSAWEQELIYILNCSIPMDTKVFSEHLASTLSNRILLLRIQCMNLYEIEEHSRDECLVGFKRIYGKTIETLEACLQKHFPMLSSSSRKEFIYGFLPFMYGMYPYVYPTEKQKNAMEIAGVKPLETSVYELSVKVITALLETAIKECI